ncbi:hypothetical protein EYF80_010861 [Liparis tanakae]|uniref:Uncharacterized protein n=1 Tax=Liparis tanakae TaxID=230148 RepID=A0A4Z2IM52_9TELE|nr:hypothetical protein EYF80_010861 [Liparis tanakae]
MLSPTSGGCALGLRASEHNDTFMNFMTSLLGSKSHNFVSQCGTEDMSLKLVSGPVVRTPLLLRPLITMETAIALSGRRHNAVALKALVQITPLPDI